MQKQLLTVGLVLATFALLSGCGTTSTTTGNTLLVGYTNSLTGDLSSYGLAFQAGAELAREQINAKAGANGLKIQFDTRDDQGDPKQCAIIAQAYAGNPSVKAVLGWSSSSCLLAGMPIYSQNQLPVLSSGTTNPLLAGRPYFHRNTVSDAVQGQLLAAYAINSLKVAKIAVFNSTDAYGTGLAKAFADKAQALGATIVMREQYPLGTLDFRASVTKLRDAKPDLVFLSGYFTEGAHVVKQAREIGVTAKFIGGEGLFSPDFITLAGQANAEGTLVANEFTGAAPGAKQFIADFQAKYHRDPGQFESLAYDAVGLLYDAASKAGGDLSRQKIQAGLASACTDGANGHECLGPDGEVVRDIGIEVVKNGQYVPAT